MMTASAPGVHLTIPIEDLTCGGGGSLTAERALSRVRGVSYVYVNPATEMAYVRFDPNQCSSKELLEALRKCGLRAEEPL